MFSPFDWNYSSLQTFPIFSFVILPLSSCFSGIQTSLTSNIKSGRKRRKLDFDFIPAWTMTICILCEFLRSSRRIGLIFCTFSSLLDKDFNQENIHTFFTSTIWKNKILFVFCDNYTCTQLASQLADMENTFLTTF